jgi:hypothetical protein
MDKLGAQKPTDAAVTKAGDGCGQELSTGRGPSWTQHSGHLSVCSFLSALIVYVKVPGMITKALDGRAEKVRN